MDQPTLDKAAASDFASDPRAHTDGFGEQSLGGVFLRSASLRGEQPALWVDGACLSYRELADRSGSIGCALAENGLANGNCRVGVLGSRGLTDYIGILGALFARCTYVPLNLRHPVHRLAAVMQEAGLDALVCGEAGLPVAQDLLRDASRRLLVLLPELIAPPDWARGMPHQFLCRPELPAAELHRLARGQGDDGAYLLFTSGSTGVPKGVLVRNRNVLPYLRAVAERYRPSAADRCTQLFDLSFDLSVHDLFLSWGAGATLYRVPDRARFAPRDFVRRHALSMWFSVPSTAATMLGLRALRPGDFPDLRLALFCGEALPKRLALAFAEAAPNAVVENLYGPTEATIAITRFRLPSDAAARQALPDVLPIGDALPGQHAVLVGVDDRPAADGETGELCLAGSQVTEGYWRRPDLTAQRFVRFAWDTNARIWYRTGDRAMRTAEHGLLFLGRLDRQVKIAGHRVELQEVEAALHQASSANSAAIAWPLGPDGLARGITGFIGGTTCPIEAVLQTCRRLLPPYAVPTAIHRVADWPTNSSGKTDYASLRQLVETTPCLRT